MVRVQITELKNLKNYNLTKNYMEEQRGASEITVDMIVSGALKGFRADLGEGGNGQRELLSILEPTLMRTVRQEALKALSGVEVGVGDSDKIQRISDFLKGVIRRLMEDTNRAVGDLRERVRMGAGRVLEGTL